ncbi:LuxR C-terminal-related transcriptional regulator [Streptomyces caelestis]|uniref:LuxR C-terminal-related transcriptional regulator n=1 Tax=Streptomyces caelestis TaxID=36816 RepID=UPI00366125BD
MTRRLIEAYVQRLGAGAGLPGVPGGAHRPGREALPLTVRGLSNTVIAERLFTGEATVGTHPNRTTTGLGFGGRARAVVVAYGTGLVVPGGSTG